MSKDEGPWEIVEQSARGGRSALSERVLAVCDTLEGAMGLAAGYAAVFEDGTAYVRKKQPKSAEAPLSIVRKEEQA